MNSLFGGLYAAILLAFSVPDAAFAAPPGTVISNQAQVDYLNVANAPATTLSNIVEVVTAVTRSPANVEWTRVVGPAPGTWQEPVGPAACFQGGSFTPLANPTLLGGSSVDPATVQQVVASETYNLGESLFIRLDDTDQNVDASVVDYAVVTVSSDASGDAETIRLTETGVNTGIFAGYVPSAGGAGTSGDCVLQGIADTNVRVSYTDPADSADSAEDTAVVDPLNVVFESRTGTTIDGSTVSLVDAVTGLPATVYGNDGVSQFPATIVSGGSTVDSSGTSYVFGPGQFRFPVVPDGNYRLIVTPPATHAAPSQVAEQVLQQLPGGPYALGPASFGVNFVKSGGVTIDFDVPVDPVESALFLQKTTTTTVASPGDFVRYELNVQNSATSGIAMNVRIVDQLPAAVRYVAGSATQDGVATADPVMSPDGRTLEFPVGDLLAGESVRFRYVVEIISGARNQEIVNTATAFADAGLSSNQSDARIRLTEDLFRTTSTLIGRIVEGHCSAAEFAEDQGVAGIRVYLEDGRFAVSDEGGRFHFEGLRPGTHVAQIDPDTVPNYFDVIACDTAPQFAGRADSQFVRTHRGSLNRVDFYLRRKAPPEGAVEIELRNIGTDNAEEVAYVLDVNGTGNLPIRSIELLALLPGGVSYLPGTLTVDGRPVGDPRVVGPSVAIDLPDQFGDWTSEVRFEASIDDDTVGELTTKAFAQFDSPINAGQKTPIVETAMLREPAVVENAGYVLNLKFAVLSAELSPADRADLDALIREWRGVNDVHIAAIGHSDSQRISPANRHIFADNYALSRARAESAANYIAGALGVPATNITVEGRGPDDPVASNASADGRQANRRVEMILNGKRPARPSFLEVTKASSGVVIAETQGAVPGMEEELLRQRLLEETEDDSGMPSSQVEPPITELGPGSALLLPAEDFSPAIPTTKISVKHGPQEKVRLQLNGEPVSPFNFDGMEVSPTQQFVISRWMGVDLRDGVNRIRAEIVDADGVVTDVLTRDINYAGTAVRGEIVPEMSVLIADGKTRPVVAVRLFDRAGEISRKGSVGTFRVNAPYRSWWEVEYERKNEIVAVGGREPLYRVGRDGIALIELEPTTDAGEAELTLNFDNRRQQDLRVWLSAAPRDWILVGFAEGTAGYNTLSDNMTAAMDAGFDDGYFDEGRVAFFAKGQVRGEYLLTMAYDSDRERSDTRDSFNTMVDPNAYYTLYADQSEQRFDAASQRKLYLKLERRQFFAMFGDFDTGLSVTELARYERRFNGLKSGYRGENAGYTVFATDTNQSFMRDEIRGDGTSGLYRLRSAPLIANSETVRIEVRDRFDTGEVLTSTTLARHLDYSLDTLAGTIYFKQPVQSRDDAFNPVFIVVEYESASSANEDIIAGGRASLRNDGDTVEFGVSHINEGQQGAESDLTGADLRWQINPETLLKAEVATSSRIESGVETKGNAHAVTLEHQGEKLDIRAYLKEVDEGFGLGQQNTAEKGVRKVGVDGRAQLTERIYVDGEASWQQNLETDAIRNTARAQMRYEAGGFTAATGVAHASDEFADGQTNESNLGEASLSRKFGKVTVRATGAVELSGEANNADLPTTVVVGADYKVMEGVELFAEYEEASGPLLDSTMTRLGVRATPWSRAQLNSSLTSESSEFGPRLFSNVGLVQGFKLSDNWSLDIGLDQSNTMTDPGLRQFDPDRELGSGSLSEDFLATYLGAAYTGESWSANSRVEHRNSDSEERISLLSGWYRAPQRGHGLSAGLTLFSSENISGAETAAADLKFGWAWRKAESRWSFLNRIDLVFEETRLVSQEEISRRLINNFNANRRLSARTQLSLQYAFKYVQNTFDGQDFSGYTDLVGADFRRGFRNRWDWGAHASVYHAYESGILDYGLGLDVGFNIRDNMWVTVGYNVAGFHDSDFSAARYTAEGPYLRIAIKADQHSLKNIAGQRR